MPNALAVVSPFRNYQKGDMITDPATIAAIKEAGEDIHCVPCFHTAE